MPVKPAIQLFKETFSEFSEDKCTRMAAALAYYTVFSIAPLLVIVIAIVGLVLSPQEAQQLIQEQMNGVLGPDGAAQVQSMVTSVSDVGSRGIIPLVLGVAGLLFGATGALSQLQDALNTAWDVRRDPEESSIMIIIMKRVLSLGMILGIAFLLLVSLVLSTVLSALGQELGALLGGGISSVSLWIFNAVISLVVVTFLFAAIFKVLPDASIAWRDVWRGAFLTAVLFEIGKFLISFYMGQSDPTSAFGAAGALALLLVWVYYSSIILFFGAEFTQAWAARSGREIEPDSGAIRRV